MKSIFLGLIVLVSTQVYAQTSANISVTSNYVWRGVTQTGHTSAVQGNLDYTMNNFTVGAWGSSLT